MWESPIKLIQKNLGCEIDNLVIKQIGEIGVDIDKNRLIEILKADRDQYEEGYADGRRAVKQNHADKITSTRAIEMLRAVRGEIAGRFDESFAWVDQVLWEIETLLTEIAEGGSEFIEQQKREIAELKSETEEVKPETEEVKPEEKR